MAKCYHIIGCGTIGYPLSERLMSMYPDRKIHLWDDDKVEEGNIVFPKQYLGEPKVEAVKDILLQYVRKSSSIVTHNQKCTNGDLKIFKNDFKINCIDEKKKFNLTTNLNVSYDGPFISISDGHIKNYINNVPQYYPKKLNQIAHGVSVIIHNLRSSFCYIYYNEKLYKVSDKKEVPPELFYSSKHGDRTSKMLKLQGGQSMVFPIKEYNEQLNKLDKKKMNKIIHTITCLDPKSRSDISVIIEDDLNTKNLINTLNLLTKKIDSPRLFARIRPTTIVGCNVASINIEIAHKITCA